MRGLHFKGAWKRRLEERPGEKPRVATGVLYFREEMGEKREIEVDVKTDVF